MALQKNIGKALRALRAQKGVSQERLALETGIGRRYMSDIENGRRNVSLEIIEKLADFFEMSASDLVKEIENAAFPPVTQKSLKRWLVEHDYNDSVVFQNPDYVSAVVGVSEEGRVIYSYEKMVRTLMMTDGMDYEEAVEFVDFNTIGALPTMGENAPIIMYEVEG
ncbi:helix-turn-helix transcriptional regulator [Candidatus Saccharibacteria bacterium]|nr:helix-turn-helix transcriptional regulator [Candidatus Saccharibacteria bacterium]